MKDYSKYFENPNAFILNYDINYTIDKDERKENYLKINTPSSFMPEVYSIESPNMVKKVEKRFEEQYRLILSKREIIKRDYIKSKEKAFNIISKCLIILLMISASFIMPVASIINKIIGLIIIGIISSIFALIIKKPIIEKLARKFDEEMDVYQQYLDNMYNLDSKCKKYNLTDHLSCSSNLNLEKNRYLRIYRVTETAFNVDFMDKASLSELKSLLENYEKNVVLFEKDTNNIIIPDEDINEFTNEPNTEDETNIKNENKKKVLKKKK